MKKKDKQELQKGQKDYRKDSIFLSAVSVSTGVFISRILGLVRQIFMAGLFGTGMAADAWGIAYPIPNSLRFLIGEGGITKVFMPKYAQIREERGEEHADHFASSFFALFATLLVIVGILLYLIAPYFINFLMFGWKGEPEKIALTVTMLRMLCPFIIFIGIYALLMGFLNSKNRFFIPALGPAMFNVIWLLGVFYVSLFSNLPLNNKFLVVVGFVVLGSAFQAFFQFPLAKKLGAFRKPKIREYWPDIRETLILFLPLFVSLMVTEVNIVVDRFLASTLIEGSVSALRYANLLVQFPISLVTTALATAALPVMARSTASKNNKELGNILTYSVRMALSVLVPIMILTVVLRTELVQLIFERGNFTKAVSTPFTASALMFYIFGIAGHSSLRVTQQAYYSLKDTITPVKVGFLAVAANIIANLLLIDKMGHNGLALGTSISHYVYFGILFYILRKRIISIRFGKIFKSVLTFLIVSGIGGGLSWVTLFLCKRYLHLEIELVQKIIYFFVPAVLGFSSIFSMYKILRLDEFDWIILPLIRKFSSIFSRLFRKSRN